MLSSRSPARCQSRRREIVPLPSQPLTHPLDEPVDRRLELLHDDAGGVEYLLQGIKLGTLQQLGETRQLVLAVGLADAVCVVVQKY